MKRIVYIFWTVVLLGLNSCSSIDSELGGVSSLRGNHIKRFYATTEQNTSSTKVYADEQLRVLWNEEDLLSVFNQSTYNSKFEFAGEDGDNAGDFEDVTPSGLHSGNQLSYIYAIYPYDKGNKINNDGNTITLTLPAEQQYKEHSFGIGANTMVAVTDNDFLAFKNLGGYLQLRLYGEDVKVSSITIQGNNGEKIAGKASIAVGLGQLPTVTMDATATEAITLVCDPSVEIGTTAEQYTDFWFVIPPVTFDGGFTITVTDEQGGVFQKTTTKSLTISRSTIEWMSALEVTLDYDNTNVVFEDANFKAYCVENFDANHDGEISISEARAVTDIYIWNRNVSSLQGIESFINLQTLDVGRCQLSSLDISKNTKLDTLWCYNNQLTSLDISNNTALRLLWCDFNQLTSLDVSNNTLLRDLRCSHNQLTGLDISINTTLDSLRCNDNQLTSLDVSKNTALGRLDCDNNQLIGLDVGNNTALTSLTCYNNQLTNLDVSKNTSLTHFACGNNKLTSLDVSNNTALIRLYCDHNQLTSLDVSNNTALINLSCDSNSNLEEIWMKTGQTIAGFLYDTEVTTIKYKDVIFIPDINFRAYCIENFDTNHDGEISLSEAGSVTAIDVCRKKITTLQGIEFFTALTYLNCRSNQLSSLDVSNNSALTYLDCSVNWLTSLVLGDNTALAHLDCYSNQLTSLDVSPNNSLEWLDCRSNWMTSLNVSKNSVLSVLQCSYNQLTNLDVSNNTALTSLSCRANQLSRLDVSNNTALDSLGCGGNNLTSLDVSHNTSMTKLSCSGTHLTSLVLGDNTALTHLDCYSNQLISLDVSHNTALIFLDCYNNQLTSLDVSHNTALTALYCSNNQLTSLDVSNNTALSWLECNSNPNLTEIWLKTGQTIKSFYYDISVATIKYKD